MQHVLTQLKLVYVETKQDFYTFIVSLICLLSHVGNDILFMMMMN